jgi:hypothetical protein
LFEEEDDEFFVAELDEEEEEEEEEGGRVYSEQHRQSALLSLLLDQPCQNCRRLSLTSSISLQPPSSSSMHNIT